MREFCFTIEYEKRADPFTDILIDTPDARRTGLICSMSESELWRIDQITGPGEAVRDLKSLLLSDEYDRLSVSDRTCDRKKRADVLEDSAEKCILYTHFASVNRCDAVSLLARRYLSGGILIEVTSQSDTERWRILMQNEQKVGMLYDTLGAVLRDGLSFHFEHLEDATEPPLNPFRSDLVPPEQQRVLEVAIEHGYYETPREATLDELASILDIPRSTVSYRLRRAEADIVKEFLAAI